jgi:CDGSH-type Zn-finger protein
MSDLINPIDIKQIEVCCDGPYIVTGSIPFVRMTQVVSEFGEPLTWRKDGELKVEPVYFLCRCGHSRHKPFCDGKHLEVKFDGTESAPVSLTSERREIYPGSKNMIVRIDVNLCTESGFCANRMTSIAELVPHTDDPQVRELVTAMIEHCPSGALTYTLNESDVDVEAHIPEQIAITTEVISEGPIQGPFWVMGKIPIIRSDGKPFERRNRVTLCSCGLSQSKPLCDGMHRVHPMIE